MYVKSHFYTKFVPFFLFFFKKLIVNILCCTHVLSACLSDLFFSEVTCDAALEI